MTRLETVARAIYEKRMSQVGIPCFQIVPWEKLPPMARAYALDLGHAALDALNRLDTEGQSNLPAPSRDQIMGRRG